LLKLHESLDQLLIVAVSVAVCCLDASQHGANRIDESEEYGGNFQVEKQLAVAQFAEQVLADMSDGFQLSESQKSAGTLDRVDRTEDAGQPLSILRRLLQHDKIPVELIQVFVALNQEFLDHIIKIVHSGAPLEFRHFSNRFRPDGRSNAKPE